jgi:glycosyltransferase involved in cell wall biosynthesis
MTTSRCIVFVSKSPHAPSTRYRALAFVPLFEQAGWQVDHVEANEFGQVLDRAKQADVTIVLRRRFGPIAAGRLRRAAKRLIYDIDDGVFIKADGSPSAKRRRGFDRMCRLADMVWAGNGYLAKRAGQIASNVTVIPTSIGPQKYAGDFAKPDDAFDAVWIGSSSTRIYLERLLPTLEEAVDRVANLRLKIVADFSLASSKLPIVVVPWSADGEAEAVGSSHVGLGPLTDDPWTRGKCGLKLLQYMAAGLPVVADNVGANGEIVSDDTGVRCGSPDDWIEGLAKLADDGDLRQRMGKAGRQRVAELYSVDAAFGRMTEQLNQLGLRP